ncbi:MAG: hypothetical protein KGL42_01335 [Betaproteobacteria bacterium]|nr:hypothetical protein [Betaproteobacteria bacterium]
MAWLLDDATLRKQNAVQVAQELGVSNIEMQYLDRGEASELLLDRAY